MDFCGGGIQPRRHFQTCLRFRQISTSFFDKPKQIVGTPVGGSQFRRALGIQTSKIGRVEVVSNTSETKYGFSAAPLVVDGAVVGATLGGEVYVLDGKNGKVLKEFDTIGPHTTLNPAVPGKGGSIDAHGLSAGAGMIFVNSGYGSFSQTPGNVLIALKPVKK